MAEPMTAVRTQELQLRRAFVCFQQLCPPEIHAAPLSIFGLLWLPYTTLWSLSSLCFLVIVSFVPALMLFLRCHSYLSRSSWHQKQKPCPKIQKDLSSICDQIDCDRKRFYDSLTNWTKEKHQWS